MTDAADFDPPPPAEGGSLMKAKDLKNRVCIFRPTGEGEFPGRPATEDQPAKGPSPYVECDVWVLESTGIVEEGTGVRVSWWKVAPGLRERIGKFVAAKPVEQDDRSVELVMLEGAARKVAAETIADLSNAEPDDSGWDGSEPV